MDPLAKVAYDQACEHDRRGQEEEAIPLYQRALELGLDGEDRRGAMLGLGSSLRNVGRTQEAVTVLQTATREFPDYPALQGFLALALYSDFRSDLGVVVLLKELLRTGNLDGYQAALGGYVEELEAEVDRLRPRP